MKQLVDEYLPGNAQFGLRVFGHKEADSCRTDLEIPLAPLNRPQAAAKVAAVNAMNLAKPPIAATLQQAGGDLAGKPGPSLIILLTDGEETCDGDPAAVIQSLRGSGLDVRVNIVAPGVTTAGMARASVDAGKYDPYVERKVIPRFGRPEDVAKVVRLLLEPDSYITGQVLAVDGGLTLRRDLP